MHCENLQFELPLYLDDVLSDVERLTIEEHLIACPPCRVKLDEFRSMKNELRLVSRPDIPSKLLQSVKSSVENALGATTIQIGSPPPKSLSELFRHWILPYSVGTVSALIITMALFSNLVSTRSAVNEIAVNQRPAQESALLAKADSVGLKEDFTLPEGFTTVALEGQTPGVNPAGALLALTKSIVRGEMEDEEVVIVADVFGSGLAKISEIVDPPSDKTAMRELKRAFETNPEEAPFLPPRMQRNSEAVRIVLKIQRVDVVD